MGHALSLGRHSTASPVISFPSKRHVYCLTIRRPRLETLFQSKLAGGIAAPGVIPRTDAQG